MMKRVNKYLYGWKLHVNYGQGWEYETFEETRAAYKENRRLYRENCTYPQRWTRGRELNPEYVALQKTPSDVAFWNDAYATILQITKGR